MGAAQTRLCPFKPLVAGSIPAALTSVAPYLAGLLCLKRKINGRAVPFNPMSPDPQMGMKFAPLPYAGIVGGWTFR